ncbi:MAG: sulfatase-like hydrolase/transferase [Planctomycetia bacterium]|nr:sulfatase-like hydrolase/transferase [Planctomycetia bacterium]
MSISLLKIESLLLCFVATTLLGCGGTSQTPAVTTEAQHTVSVETTATDTADTVSKSEVRGTSDAPPAPRQRSADKRPNILLIYTDDQSCQTLSCYEDAPAFVDTPNIDRLAKEGVRFTSCYGAASCSVSRLIMLTGLQPHAIQGVKSEQGTTYDPHLCRFWPATLRQAGYHTSMVGKWHLGDDAGHGRDWDHSVVWQQPPGLGALRDPRNSPYLDPALTIDGQGAHKATGYSTDLYSKHAVEYIRRDHDQPWFLWLCYNAPHAPLQPHSRHQDRYRDAPVRVPLVTTPVSRYMHSDQAEYAESVRQYHRLICAVDEGVAEVRQALEETGQLDNTIIIFTSDNGYAWGENGIQGKLVAYHAHMRIPLIVRFPAVAQAGAVCRTPVALVDLPPTLLALTGESQPWPMHGRDVQHLLQNPDAGQDDPVMLENFYTTFGRDTDGGRTNSPTLNGIPWWLSLTDSRYQYIRSLVPDVIEEFYDLRADPLELRNLALEPSRAEQLADYRRRLIDELQRTDAKLVKNLPEPRLAPGSDEH